MPQQISLYPEETLMFREASEAADVVSGQIMENAALLERIGAKLRELKPSAVVTCARGSSDHAATFAKYVIETKLGVPVSSAAPSVTSVYAAKQMLKGTLFIAISQSGASPDLVRATEAAKAGGAYVIALVNVVNSPLAAVADDVVPLRAGPETSVAATKTYIATLAAILQLVANWSCNHELVSAMASLPSNLRAAWSLDWGVAVDALEDVRNLFVVGRGLGFGVAQEAALKLKETCGLHAEAYSAAEVKHGPMAIVNQGFPVLVMSQCDQTRSGIQDLVKDFESRGAHVLVVGRGLEGGTTLPTLDGTHPMIEPLLFIQSFYRMANSLSVARGYHPDRPPHLNKVTETV